ncbi:MAG: hypothetical protein SGBAC_008762 [Bacillariaceae sp.]
MPVIAPPSYNENKRAGSALENAAEEILNGIFCHYEPPTSTKAQKNASQAVRKNPSKFLYDEQPTKLMPRRKVAKAVNNKSAKAATANPTIIAPTSDHESNASYYESETDGEDFNEDDEASIADDDEDYDDLDDDDEESVQKVGKKSRKKGGIKKESASTSSKRGIKWRDQESKRIEEEKVKLKEASRWSQCMALPCFTADGNDLLPDTLEDIQQENEPPQEPTPTAAATPTKSALKKSDDGVMKVLYDDQGNPNTTPRSPGTIQGHSFFRNVTNSPRNARGGGGGGVYEPADYSKPSTPKGAAFRMPRDFTPRRNLAHPAPPSDVGAPSPRSLPVKSFVPRSPSIIPGSPGVSDYNFAQSMASASPRFRQIGPLPGSPGIHDQLGGPEVIRLAKIGRNSTTNAVEAPEDAWSGVDPGNALNGSYVARSPKSYMTTQVAPPQPIDVPKVEEDKQLSVIQAVQLLDGKSALKKVPVTARVLAPQPIEINTTENVTATIDEPKQMSVIEAVQMLNKAGFNPGKRFNRGFNKNSYRRAKQPKSPSTTHHGYATTANDNRDSFVGTRRVAAAPAPLVQHEQSNHNNSAAAALHDEIKQNKKKEVRVPFGRVLDVNTQTRDEVDMSRDPTPRNIQKNPDWEGGGGFAALPPTPRRKEREPEFDTNPTPTSAQKPPKNFAPVNDHSVERKPSRDDTKFTHEKEVAPPPKAKAKKEETKVAENKTQSRPSQSRSSQSRPSQSRSQTRSAQQPKKEKKGFMSGIKKGFGKLKNTVNEIDSQRIAEPTNNKKKSGNRRDVRMA